MREYYIISNKMLEYVEACIKILNFHDDILVMEDWL